MQCRGNVSDHVQQEGVGFNVHDDPIPFTPHFAPIHSPHGGMRLASGTAKTAEIMLAQ
jgi:hypothetical protein